MNSKGYALPTVLFISMIIIILSVGITFSLRSNLGTVRELQDHVQASLETHSAMNEAFYAILTSSQYTHTGIRVQQGGGEEVEWNLYGDPIIFSETVTLKLRDCSGMISPLLDQRYMEDLVAYTTHDVRKSAIFADTFSDWQDKDDLKRLNGAEAFDFKDTKYQYVPRNFFIQIPEEVMLIKGFDPEIFGKIKNDLVYWKSGDINYLTMNEELLKALVNNDESVERVIKLRSEGKLTRKIFTDVTGMQISEMDVGGVSGWMKVEVTAKVGEASSHAEAVLAKKETFDRPFVVTEWKT